MDPDIPPPTTMQSTSVGSTVAWRVYKERVLDFGVEKAAVFCVQMASAIASADAWTCMLGFWFD